MAALGECGRDQLQHSLLSRGNATFRERLYKDVMRRPRQETQRWHWHRTTAIRRSQPPLTLASLEGREQSPPIRGGRYPQCRPPRHAQHIKVWPTLARGAEVRLWHRRGRKPGLRHAGHRISPGQWHRGGTLLEWAHMKRPRRTLHNRRHDV